MVMAKRPDVERSSGPIAAADLAGLLGQMTTTMVRVPFLRTRVGRVTAP